MTKTVGTSTKTYHYVGGMLYGEKAYDSETGYDTITYLYDEGGSPYGYIHNTSAYYYEKNIQGDVIGIWNASGKKIAAYTYDAWGNILSITDGNGNDLSNKPRYEANINPIRYRGYHYDAELNMYWLTTRFYDPEIGRFINADTQLNDGMLGNNLYAYCGNDPVNMFDSNGEAPLKVSRYLLNYWIYGRGKKLIIPSTSFVVDALKKSKLMKKEIEAQIKKFEKGETYGSGSVRFTKSETDLWLGIRHANYKMTIVKETESRGIWFWKKTKTRYKVTITITDTYNFNTGNEKGDGIGSVLNNLGYQAQKRGLGKEYRWEATYDYYTKWK